MMQMAERAATVRGLTDLDLNFPDHVSGQPAAIARRIGDLGLSVNGLAMRYYTNPAFKRGAFTNPGEAVRREAIDLTKRGIDILVALERLMDDATRALADRGGVGQRADAPSTPSGQGPGAVASASTGQAGPR